MENLIMQCHVGSKTDHLLGTTLKNVITIFSTLMKIKRNLLEYY